MLLRDLIGPTAATAPDRMAVEGSGQSYTYRQLNEASAALARMWLDDGLETGDRVAFLMPNRPETVLAYLACFKAGLVAVPLDYRYQPPQINYALRHSGSRLLVCHPERLAEVAECEAARGLDLLVVGEAELPKKARRFTEWEKFISTDPLPDRFRPDDYSVIFYTSGTTSRPKGVTMTRAAMAAGTTKVLGRIPLSPADVALVASPVARPFALRTQVLPLLRVGGSVTLMERFTPQAYLAHLKQAPAKTFLAILPSALHQVVQHPEARTLDYSALRICISGSDRVPLALQKAFHALTGLEVTEQCGMTETAMYALNPPLGRKKPGSIGLPMYGVQVCLVDKDGQDVPVGDVGEICVKSPLGMEGYWNDTAQTKKVMRDGWVLSGDLGRFDEDGYLWFMGRKKDVIVRDGANISPIEVEETLLAHPAISEACVVAVTDAVHGQNVHVFVTLQDGQQLPGEEELKQFAGARLSRQAPIERVHIVPELPRTGTGKVDRDRLQWQAEAGNENL